MITQYIIDKYISNILLSITLKSDKYNMLAKYKMSKLRKNFEIGKNVCYY